MIVFEAITLHMASIRKANTLASYREALEPFGEALGMRAVESVRPLEVEEFIKGAWPGISDSTRYLRFSQLRAVFNTAWRYERKQTGKPPGWANPCASLEIRRPQAVKRPMRHMERVEAIRGKLRPRHALIYDLGTVAGMRVSEILKFRARDLWNNSIRIENPKSGRKEEHVALSKDIARRLAEYIEAQGIGPNDRVFPYSRQAVYQVFHRRGVAPHDLRRFAASRWALAGLPMVAIQGFLRHASVTTTERYVGALGVSEVSDIIEKVNGG